MHRPVWITICVALLTCTLSLVYASSAQADLSLSIPSTTFYTNQGTATLDVNITGDGTTSFGNFTLDFAITDDASNLTTPLETIEFVAPPTDPTLDPTLNDPNYVFAGNSLDLDPFFPTPFGTVSGLNNTLLSVADSTDNFNDVTLGNGAIALMAKLEFTVPTNVTNSAGDKFDVTLLNPTTALQSNVNTPPSVSLSGNFVGVVTVEQPAFASVPEPATFGLLLCGAAGVLLTKRRRDKARG